MTAFDEIIQTAFTIALINLRHSYNTDGIYAGQSHFSDIWARDSLFASLGAIEVNDIDIVKRNLTTLMTYMNPDGQIPLRIGQKYFILKLLGVTLKKEARYKEDKANSTTIDSNSLFIIIWEQYLEKTKDITLTENHFEELKKIMDWNFLQDKDNDLLIEENSYAGWTDSLKKKGKVCYTNILHYKALDSFAKICKKTKEMNLARYYQDLAEKVKEKINSEFWNQHYYIDQIRKKKKDILSTESNLLAILFEIADSAKTKHIFKSFKDYQLENEFCIKTCYPKYPFTASYLPFHLLRMNDYHNGLLWLWIGCLNAVTKFQSGDTKQAHQILFNIAEKIIESKGIFEVYDHEKPLHRFWYKSEYGFTWTAGMFVWACKITRLK